MSAEPATVGEILDQNPIVHPVAHPVPAAMAAGSPITPMQMMQIAIERGANMEMLERLMTLQERYETNEARKAYVAALARFKADPPTIIKNKSASFGAGKTAYTYAGLDQIAATIGAALSLQGLSASWRTEQVEGRIRVTCELRHALGHSEQTSLEAGADTSGSKNGIQAIGSTVTYLSKYTLLAICGLAAGDQDDDAHGADDDAGAELSDEQKETLVSMLKEAKADTVKFLTHFKVGSIDALPPRDFKRARDLLQQKINLQKEPTAP